MNGSIKIILVAIGGVVLVASLLLGSSRAGAQFLTPQEQQQLQQLFADPAFQQQLIQNPQALVQNLLANPETKDLAMKLLFPTTGSQFQQPTSFEQLFDPSGLLQQFPDLQQYLQFLPQGAGGLPAPSEIQQLFEQSLGANQLNLFVSTPTPLPQELVQAAAEVPGVDARNVNYRWFLDGKLVKSGLSEDRFEFVAKAKVGENSALRVTATLPNGTVLASSKTLRVGDIILSFSAQSTTPSTYKGLNLPALGSEVKMSARALLPFSVPSSQISYKWSVNGRAAQTNSSNAFAFGVSQAAGGREEVGVEVANLSGTLLLKKTLRLPVSSPQVFIYQDKYNLVALKDQVVSGGQALKLVALPYFFKTQTEELAYRWRFLDNEVLGGGEEPNVLEAVAPEQNLFGRIFRNSLNVVVQNPQDIFEQAQVALPLAIQ